MNGLIRVRSGGLAFCPYITPWDVLKQNERTLNCRGQRLGSRVKNPEGPLMFSARCLIART